MELVGLEPTTSAMPLQRSSKLSYSPIFNGKYPNGRERALFKGAAILANQPLSVKNAS